VKSAVNLRSDDRTIDPREKIRTLQARERPRSSSLRIESSLRKIRPTAIKFLTRRRPRWIARWTVTFDPTISNQLASYGRRVGAFSPSDVIDVARGVNPFVPRGPRRASERASERAGSSRFQRLPVGRLSAAFRRQRRSYLKQTRNNSVNALMAEPLRPCPATCTPS